MECVILNYLGSLAQGIFNILGNDALEFIPKHDVPKNKTITYSRMVYDYRTLKKDKYMVGLTVGGNLLQYPEDIASPASSLLETKLLLNSTIFQSIYCARLLTLEIDFFQTES